MLKAPTLRSHFGKMAPPGSQQASASIVGKSRSAGIPADQAMFNRIDGLEQSQHETMDQMLKMSQELKMEMRKKDGLLEDEKNARTKVEQQLLSCNEQLEQTKACMKRVEAASMENMKKIGQLISHNKNVERAVTMNAQDLVNGKEGQKNEIQELKQKITAIAMSRDKLERLTHTNQGEIKDLANKIANQSLEVSDVQVRVGLQNKMLEAQNEELLKGQQENKKGKMMSETTKTSLETKILKLQTFVGDVQTQLNHEKKELEVKFVPLTARIDDCKVEIEETRRSQEADVKSFESKIKELAAMSDAEKQQIIMQISSVQTDLKMAMDERDTSLKQTTDNKIEELQKELELESEQRNSNELEIRNRLEAESTKLKLYSDESIEAARKLNLNEIETLTTRTQELREANNVLETHLAKVKSETNEEFTKCNYEAEGREKLLEAKIEDMGDRLRLGMGKLQQAIGETNTVDTSKLKLEDTSGLREKIRGEMNLMEKEMTTLRSKIDNHEELIENQLKSQQQQDEDQSSVLGDKLSQKMDTMAFSQERLKRQFDDLKADTKGIPTEIFDMKKKMVTLERDCKGNKNHQKVTQEQLGAIEGNVLHIMGRGETNNVSGIPTLPRLLDDIDNVRGSHKKAKTEFDDFKKNIMEKLEDEKRKRESDMENFQQDQERAEKRTEDLKETMKKLAAPGKP